MFTAKTVDSAIAQLQKTLENLIKVCDFQAGEAERLRHEYDNALVERDRAARIATKLKEILK